MRLILIFLFFSNSAIATSVSPKPCTLAKKSLSVAPAIVIESIGCWKKKCSVEMLIDTQTDSFKFTNLYLQRTSSPQVLVELKTQESGQKLRAWVDGDAHFFENVILISGYKNEENCEVVSKTELTHNKERNALDATIVAPIR